MQGLLPLVINAWSETDAGERPQEVQIITDKIAATCSDTTSVQKKRKGEKARSYLVKCHLVSAVNLL
jgi:hypothetical protein